jgi:hypothetical protein
MNLTITPDGPRGPRRKLAPGAIFVASRLELPLVVMGYAYDRPWRFNSWDRFALPRPFSRARAVVSPEITVPRNLDREGLEHYRQKMEDLLNRLTTEAEIWAESGTRRIGQRHVERHGAPLRRGTKGQRDKGTEGERETDKETRRRGDKETGTSE